jgi:hypothetical protein
MVGHPEYIAGLRVLAVFGGSTLGTKHPLQVPKKQVSRLQYMVHRPQQGRAISARREVIL